MGVGSIFSAFSQLNVEKQHICRTRTVHYPSFMSSFNWRSGLVGVEAQDEATGVNRLWADGRKP